MARGPQAANLVGTHDETDVFHTITRAIGASG
jgi:alkaline phosphatase